MPFVNNENQNEIYQLLQPTLKNTKLKSQRDLCLPVQLLPYTNWNKSVDQILNILKDAKRNVLITYCCNSLAQILINGYKFTDEQKQECNQLIATISQSVHFPSIFILKMAMQLKDQNLKESEMDKMYNYILKYPVKMLIPVVYLVLRKVYNIDITKITEKQQVQQEVRDKKLLRELIVPLIQNLSQQSLSQSYDFSQKACFVTHINQMSKNFGQMMLFCVQPVIAMQKYDQLTYEQLKLLSILIKNDVKFYIKLIDNLQEKQLQILTYCIAISGAQLTQEQIKIPKFQKTLSSLFQQEPQILCDIMQNGNQIIYSNVYMECKDFTFLQQNNYDQLMAGIFSLSNIKDAIQIGCHVIQTSNIDKRPEIQKSSFNAVQTFLTQCSQNNIKITNGQYLKLGVSILYIYLADISCLDKISQNQIKQVYSEIMEEINQKTKLFLCLTDNNDDIITDIDQIIPILQDLGKEHYIIGELINIIGERKGDFKKIAHKEYKLLALLSQFVLNEKVSDIVIKRLVVCCQQLNEEEWNNFYKILYKGGNRQLFQHLNMWQLQSISQRSSRQYLEENIDQDVNILQQFLLQYLKKLVETQQQDQHFEINTKYQTLLALSVNQIDNFNNKALQCCILICVNEIINKQDDILTDSQICLLVPTMNCLIKRLGAATEFFSIQSVNLRNSIQNILSQEFNKQKLNELLLSNQFLEKLRQFKNVTLREPLQIIQYDTIRVQLCWLNEGVKNLQESIRTKTKQVYGEQDQKKIQKQMSEYKEKLNIICKESFENLLKGKMCNILKDFISIIQQTDYFNTSIEYIIRIILNNLQSVSGTINFFNEIYVATSQIKSQYVKNKFLSIFVSSLCYIIDQDPQIITNIDWLINIDKDTNLYYNYLLQSQGVLNEILQNEKVISLNDIYNIMVALKQICYTDCQQLFTIGMLLQLVYTLQQLTQDINLMYQFQQQLLKSYGIHNIFKSSIQSFNFLTSEKIFDSNDNLFLIPILVTINIQLQQLQMKYPQQQRYRQQLQIQQVLHQSQSSQQQQQQQFQIDYDFFYDTVQQCSQNYIKNFLYLYEQNEIEIENNNLELSVTESISSFNGNTPSNNEIKSSLKYKDVFYIFLKNLLEILQKLQKINSKLTFSQLLAQNDGILNFLINQNQRVRTENIITIFLDFLIESKEFSKKQNNIKLLQLNRKQKQNSLSLSTSQNYKIKTVKIQYFQIKQSVICNCGVKFIVQIMHQIIKNVIFNQTNQKLVNIVELLYNFASNKTETSTDIKRSFGSQYIIIKLSQDQQFPQMIRNSDKQSKMQLLEILGIVNFDYQINEQLTESVRNDLNSFNYIRGLFKNYTNKGLLQIMIGIFRKNWQQQNLLQYCEPLRVNNQNIAVIMPQKVDDIEFYELQNKLLLDEITYVYCTSQQLQKDKDIILMMINLSQYLIRKIIINYSICRCQNMSNQILLIIQTVYILYKNVILLGDQYCLDKMKQLIQYMDKFDIILAINIHLQHKIIDSACLQNKINMIYVQTNDLNSKQFIDLINSLQQLKQLNISLNEATNLIYNNITFQLNSLVCKEDVDSYRKQMKQKLSEQLHQKNLISGQHIVINCEFLKYLKLDESLNLKLDLLLKNTNFVSVPFTKLIQYINIPHKFYKEILLLLQLVQVIILIQGMQIQENQLMDYILPLTEYNGSQISIIINKIVNQIIQMSFKQFANSAKTFAQQIVQQNQTLHEQFITIRNTFKEVELVTLKHMFQHDQVGFVTQCLKDIFEIDAETMKKTEENFQFTQMLKNTDKQFEQ